MIAAQRKAVNKISGIKIRTTASSSGNNQTASRICTSIAGTRTATEIANFFSSMRGFSY